MRTVLVTIDSPAHSMDCEVPGDLQVSDLMPLLLDICGLGETHVAPVAKDVSIRAWALGLPTGQRFAERESLIACGVVDGMRLLLRDRSSWDTAPPARLANMPGEDISPSQATGGIGVRWNRDGLDS